MKCHVCKVRKPYPADPQQYDTASHPPLCATCRLGEVKRAGKKLGLSPTQVMKRFAEATGAPFELIADWCNPENDNIGAKYVAPTVTEQWDASMKESYLSEIERLTHSHDLRDGWINLEDINTNPNHPECVSE